MNNRTFAMGLVVSVIVGVAHGLVFCHMLGLDIGTAQSWIVPLSLFYIVVGWLLVGVFVLAPGGKAARFRYVVRSLIFIFAGTAGLGGVAGSEILATIPPIVG